MSQMTNQKKFYINKCIINMESNDELKEIDIKNRICCYFDEIIRTEGFDFDNILLDNNHMKMFWFMTFHTKPWLVLKLYVLGSII